MTRTHHLDTNKSLGIYSTRCGHCQQTTVHELRVCGQERVCSVCTQCEWHKRIGTPWPKLTDATAKDTNQNRLFPPGHVV